MLKNKLWFCASFVSNIVQFGNTSIGLARKLAVVPISNAMSGLRQIKFMPTAYDGNERDIQRYNVCELSIVNRNAPRDYDQMLD
jgi:hypothetical protein